MIHLYVFVLIITERQMQSSTNKNNSADQNDKIEKSQQRDQKTYLLYYCREARCDLFKTQFQNHQLELQKLLGFQLIKRGKATAVKKIYSAVWKHK